MTRFGAVNKKKKVTGFRYSGGRSIVGLEILFRKNALRCCIWCLISKIKITKLNYLPCGGAVLAPQSISYC